MSKKGVLLVNLGTPDSPKVKDVRRYLDQFLMDGRVIDIPKFPRTLLVKGIIVPFRGPKSAATYKEIWEPNGSPLLYYSEIQARKLQAKLGADYRVELAMRYQNPSIESALAKLKAANVDQIKVIPLFPQYASATTGSVIQEVMDIVSKWFTIPPISFINSFHDHPGIIEVFANNALKYDISGFDHVLFSFHGLPERQLVKSDDSKSHCLKTDSCCQVYSENNKFCYGAQSYHTAKLIAERLHLPKEKYTVCFQSRLGKDAWVQPYASDVLKQLAQAGKKRLLVFSPAFVADCIETVHEISVEYLEEFQHEGGDTLQLVESLNDDPKFIEVLEDLVHRGV